MVNMNQGSAGDRRWYLRSSEVMSLGNQFGDIPILEENAVQDLLVAAFAGTKEGATLDDAKEAADKVINDFKEGMHTSFWVKSRRAVGYIIYQ